MKNNVYQMVTDRIIEQMEKGIIPWQKPWSGVGLLDGGAVNYVTRKPYSLLNQMLLGRKGEYLTFKQVKALGGDIKKGAKSSMVVFFTMAAYKDEKSEEPEEKDKLKTFPLLRYYRVFHLDDTTGIESKMPKEEETKENELKPVEAAEAIISGYLSRESRLKFQNDKPSAQAYYSPTFDEVVVPMMSQYAIVEEYYSTTFHELTHSTMKRGRCDRKSENKLAAFGNEEYSREELVAEIGSAMLCNYAGLDNEKAFKNSVAYIQGWLSHLKDDNKAIVWAASRAEAAAKYIIGE